MSLAGKTFKVMLVLAILAGCASTPLPPPERQVEVAASPDSALKAGLAVLVERGFVIQLADAGLGRVDAVRASRPGYEIRFETHTTATGARLTLSGRQGRQAIDPQRFERVLTEIAERLEAGS